MTTRPLATVACPTGDAVLREVLPAVGAALDGSGPALVPVPDGPVGVAVRRMARLDVPVDSSVALVVPTSGSTGEPKGALLTAAALQASARATLNRLGGPGRWLLALPTTHVAGLQVLVRSLLAGTEPLVLDLAGGFDPGAFADGSRMISAGLSGGAGARRRYTALVPTQLRRLLEAGDDVVAALASYDAVLLGGAAAPPDLLAAARAVGVRVVTTYGMSETCGGCVYDGVPLDGVRVRLGEGGRVELGGPMVFAGYRGRPDLTAAARRVDADGIARHITQDLGALDADGRLDVLGRIDDVIVTGGENVAPDLVERALASYAGIRELAVVGVPDPEWGQRVVAVVVPVDDAAVPILDALRSHGAHRLPSYALPRSLVIADAIPMLASGKPDRLALRALAAPASGQAG